MSTRRIAFFVVGVGWVVRQGRIFMLGTMLWFNREKGYGFIRTEDDERIYVAGSGFLAGHQPARRCRGQNVRFDRHVAEGDTRAVNVSIVPQAQPPRARIRSARGGHAL